MRYDLHTHSTRSDGTTPPAVNVKLAAAAGLAGVALTDHDTFDGWDEAAQACRRLGITFVPGVELSAELGGRSVHLLGYWVDPDDEALAAECARLREERDQRAVRILAKLAGLGVTLDISGVHTQAAGAPIGRPHIAGAMVDAGIVGSVQEAFDWYLADGGPAYVEKHALHPVAAVALLRAAGGAVVLAHPGLSTPALLESDLIDDLVAAGLSGIEAEHSAHDADTVAAWTLIARERDLVVTGSSDFHGTAKTGVHIGARTTGAAALEALTAHSSRPVATTRGV